MKMQQSQRRVRTMMPIVLLGAGFLTAASAEEKPAARPIVTPGEVVVVRSDDRSLVFEYRPHYAAPREIQQERQTFLLYDFSGSVSAEAHKNSGSPDLRYRNFPLALPGESGTTVQVIAADYEDIPSVTFAPIPTVRKRENMLETGTYAMNSAAYGTPGFVPAAVAELAPVVNASRSLLLSAVRVYPLQLDPTSRILRKYSRIVVQVSYGQRTTRPLPNKDEVPFGNVLLNSNMASSWKVSADPGVIKSSVLRSGQWYRITVQEDGIYRLTSQALTAAGINLSSVDPRTIKIYGNSGKEVPENLGVSRPEDLVENAAYVEGEVDGRFDAGDFVLFYGRAPHGLTYDVNARTLRHYINHYSDVNYYWLTFGDTPGKRMAPQSSLSEGSVYAPDKFMDGVAVEKESENLLRSGKDWYGQRIEPNSSFTLLNVLPGLVPNDVVVYRYALVAASERAPTFVVKDGSTLLGTYSSLGTTSEYIVAKAGSWQATGPSSLANNTSQLNIAFQTPSAGAKAWIDWVEIIYPRMFWAVGNVLRFRAPDTSAVVEYRLQQFTESPWVFNITSDADVRLVTGVTGSFAFQASEVARQPSDYWAGTPATWKAPVAIESQTNQDLRGFAEGVEFIIITSREYRAPVDRLASYRQSQGMSTVVAEVNQIYNEFAGGLPDITGIRDYLRYAYNNWTQRPRYVLFFGQGSYDYKGIMDSRSSYVPTWQSAESRDDIESYSTDDFFAKFGASNALSLVLGRISPRSIAEANTIVDKLIRYDNNSASDSWKLRIVYVGDDSWTPEREDGITHSADIEDLAEAHTPNVFEKRKIYLAEYPTEFSAQGRRKPGAYQAIIDNINQGALIFNFAGHGNPEQLGHENIFNVQTSIPQLVNSDRLAMFILATCNFSQFDDPQRYTGGELLMNKADGAAIAVISATRKVYASENAELNQGMYDYLFQRDVFGHVITMRPAEALFLYKSSPQGNGTNDQKFFFMGDPTMRLQFPSQYASIDSINQQSVDSLEGDLRATPILIHALSRVAVSGTIRKQGNEIDETYNGKLTLLVSDPTRRRVILNFYNNVDWPYKATGGTIFRGENSIVNGRFKATFVVPRDVSLADSMATGRMLTYFTNGSVDGAGITERMRIGGPDSVQTIDQQGPTITIFLDNRSFHPGDMVSEKPTLIVDLEDSNGINTSSSGIGHRIEAWINDATQSTDVTEAYTSKLDNYMEGSVQYQLNHLPLGRNTLRVRAWDSFDNSSTAETFFDVASTDDLTLTDVMNYPNPFAGSTLFTFRQNQSGLLNVVVKIYTVAGRLIQTLTTISAGESFVRVPWDGRDRDGDILANGVYFYKVRVTTADGRFNSEAIGKLSIVK